MINATENSESNLVRRLTRERGITQDQLAQELGITQGAISQWNEVPYRRVLEIERLTGIPRHELRPDIYPPPDAALPVPVPRAPVPLNPPAGDALALPERKHEREVAA